MARTMDRRIAAGNNECVAKALLKYPLGKYGQNGPIKDFIQNLLDSGRLTLMAPKDGPPLHLYFFDDRPLIGFMPPEIKKRVIDDQTAALDFRVSVLKPELMPTSPNDQRGLNAAAFMCVLQMLLSARNT